MGNHGKKAYVNGAIIAVNIIYFLFLEITGSSLNTGFMVKRGAMYAPLILQYGEYYRLLTSVFMHFGIGHLINNMLVLLPAMRYRCKYYIFGCKHGERVLCCFGRSFRRNIWCCRRTRVCGGSKPWPAGRSEYTTANDTCGRNSVSRVYEHRSR